MRLQSKFIDHTNNFRDQDVRNQDQCHEMWDSKRTLNLNWSPLYHVIVEQFHFTDCQWICGNQDDRDQQEGLYICSFFTPISTPCRSALLFAWNRCSRERFQLQRDGTNCRVRPRPPDTYTHHPRKLHDAVACSNTWIHTHLLGPNQQHQVYPKIADLWWSTDGE